MDKPIDSEQPKEEFRCKIDGCKQSFDTEVHRNVHSKKHDLSLSLEMPLKGAAEGLFADQTPTPTRLIGKCEEVGLFEDLKKVNPFDETFRRAVESGTVGSPLGPDDASPTTTSVLSVPCCRMGEGETLHTPHIFPNSSERNEEDAASGTVENVTKQQRSSKNKASPSRAKQLAEAETKAASSDRKKAPKRTAVKRKAPAVVDILPRPALPLVAKAVPLIIIPSNEPEKELQPVESSSPGNQSDPVQVKEKLKEHLAKVRESRKGKKEKTATTVKRTDGGSGDEESRKNTIKTAKPTDATKPSDDQSDLKHERWKAAAKRYRIRVKNSQDQQHQRNILLEEENLRLRTEIAALKHAHRNCSVTREMKTTATLIVQPRVAAHGISNAATMEALDAGVAGQSMGGAGTIIYNTADPHHPIPLSTPQQRLITSHIIDSHSMNRNPIFIVIGPGTEPVVPVTVNSALAGKSTQNG